MSLSHGGRIVPLFDTLFQLLGPDTEFIQQVTYQIGRRHKDLGIAKSYFPKMGLALVYVLRQTLRGSHSNHKKRIMMTAEDLDAWRDVYKTLSDEMLRAMEEE